MKIKVSQTMVNFIKKMAKNNELNIECVELKWFSERGYTLNLGTMALLDAEEYNDWDFDDEGNYKYKCIIVCYPYNYYAMPRYITTAELAKEAKRRNVKTEQELKDMLKEMIEI